MSKVLDLNHQIARHKTDMYRELDGAFQSFLKEANEYGIQPTCYNNILTVPRGQLRTENHQKRDSTGKASETTIAKQPSHSVASTVQRPDMPNSNVKVSKATIAKRPLGVTSDAAQGCTMTSVQHLDISSSKQRSLKRTANKFVEANEV